MCPIIESFLTQVVDVWLSYPSKLERIPNDSRVDVITIKQTKLQLEMGSFVTLKQFPYKVCISAMWKSKPLFCI
jgi:hypothetical protein